MAEHLEHPVHTIAFRGSRHRMLLDIGPQHTARHLAHPRPPAAHHGEHLLARSVVVEHVQPSDNFLITHKDPVVGQMPHVCIHLMQPVERQSRMREDIRNVLHHLQVHQLEQIAMLAECLVILLPIPAVHPRTGSQIAKPCGGIMLVVVALQQYHLRAVPFFQFEDLQHVLVHLIIVEHTLLTVRV